MAPVTRRTAFPKVLIERDSESEQSSSEEEGEEEEERILEEEEEEDDDDDDGVTTTSEKTENLEVGSDANKKGKAPITISLKKVCKVIFFFFCRKVQFFLLSIGTLLP